MALTLKIHDYNFETAILFMFKRQVVAFALYLLFLKFLFSIL
jgi:hypothetical protein